MKTRASMILAARAAIADGRLPNEVAMDEAVDRVAANRLTVEQIMELVRQYGAAKIYKGFSTTGLLYDRIEAAIRANHRDTKP